MKQPSNSSSRALGDVCVQLLARATTANEPTAFCAEALKLIDRHFDFKSATVIQGHTGRWRSVAKIGADQSPPDELISDAADRDQMCKDDHWIVAPMPAPAEPGWLLAGRAVGTSELDESCQRWRRSSAAH